MPDLLNQEQFEAMQELERRGALSANQQLFLKGASEQRERTFANTDLSNLSRIIAETDDQRVDEITAEGLMDDFLGKQFNTGWQQFFGADVPSRTAFGRLRTMIDPKRFKDNPRYDLWTDLEAFRAKDFEQQAAAAKTEGLWLPGDMKALEFVASGVSALLSPFGVPRISPGNVLDKDIIAKHESNLLKKDLISMNLLYESNMSEAGKEYGRAISTGVAWSDGLFRVLPETDRALMGGFVQLRKPVVDEKLLSESATRAATSFVDMGLGAVDFVSYKSQEAWSTFVTANNQNVLDIDETKIVNKQRRDALRTKWQERSFGGKALTGLADSAALLTSLAVAGEIKFASWGAKLVALGLPTAGLARDIEADMLERGVDGDIVGLVAMPLAMGTMAVEKISLDILFKGLKGKLVPGVLATKWADLYLDKWTRKAGKFVVQRAGRAVWTGSVIQFTETMEEVIQETGQELATQMGLGDVQTRRLLEIGLETAIAVQPTVTLFGAFGGLGGAISNGTAADSRTAADIVDDMNTIKQAEAKLSQLLFPEADTEKPATATEKPDTELVKTGPSDKERQAKFDTVFNEWQEAPDAEARKHVLRSHSVLNIDASTQLFEELAERKQVFAAKIEILRPTLLASISAESIEQRELQLEANVATAVAEGKKLGLDADVVDDVLVSPEGQLMQASIEGDTAKLSSLSEDPIGDIREEAFHHIINSSDLPQEQKDILNESVPRLVEEFGINALYPKATDLVKAEEAVANKFRGLPEGEQKSLATVWQTIDKLSNLFKGRGFQTAETILGGLEQKRRGEVSQKQLATEPTVEQTQRGTDVRPPQIESLKGAVKATAIAMQDGAKLVRSTTAKGRPASTFELQDASGKKLKSVSAKTLKQLVDADVLTATETDLAGDASAYEFNKTGADLGTQLKAAALRIKDVDSFAARLIANELMKKGKVTKADIKRRLSELKLEPDMEAALAEALEIVGGQEAKFQAIKQRAKIVAEIESRVALKRLEVQIERAQRLGRAEGELFEKLRQAELKLRADLREAGRAEKRDAKTAEKKAEKKARDDFAREARKRPGMDAGDLTGLGYDILADIAGEKVTAEESMANLEALLHDALVAEGLLSADATDSEINLNEALRTDFAKTAAGALMRAATDLVLPGASRQDFIHRARNLRKSGSEMKGLRTEAKGLFDSIRGKAIQQTRKKLKESIKDTLDNFESRERLSDNAREYLRIAQRLSTMTAETFWRTLRKAKDDIQIVTAGGETLSEQRAREQQLREAQLTLSAGMLIEPLINADTPLLEGQTPIAKLAVLDLTLKDIAEGVLKTIADIDTALEERSKLQKSELNAAIIQAKPKVPIDKKDNFWAGIKAGLFNSELKMRSLIRFSVGEARANAMKLLKNWQTRIKTANFNSQVRFDKVNERKLALMRSAYNVENEFAVMRTLTEQDEAFDKFALPGTRTHLSRGTLIWMSAMIKQRFYRELAKLTKSAPKSEAELEEEADLQDVEDIAPDEEKDTDLATEEDLKRPEVPVNESLAQLLAQEAEIDALLTAEDHAFLDGLIDIISEELTDDELEASGRINGTLFDVSETRYFPALFRVTHPVVEISQVLSVVPPSHEIRVKHGRDIDYTQDVLTMFDRHVNNTVRFIEYGELTEELRRSFLSSEVRGEVGDTYGEEYARIITRHFVTILTGKPAVGTSKIPGLTKARAWISLKWLSFSGSTMSKQFGGTLAIVNHHDMPDLSTLVGATFNSPRSEEIRAKIMAHPAYIRRKTGTITEVAENVIRQSHVLVPAGALNLADKIHPMASKRIVQGLRLGPQINGWADAMGALLVAPAGVNWLMQTDPTIMSISDQDARESAAVDRFMTIVEQSLQSAQLEELVDWVREGGELQKAAVQFMSSPQQQLGQMLFNIEEYRANPTKKNFAKMRDSFLINHVLLPTVFSLVSSAIQWGLGDEPDEGEILEWILAMLAGPFGSIVFVGGIMMAFSRSLLYTAANPVFEAAGLDKPKLPAFGERILPVADLVRDGKLLGQLIGDALTLNGTEFRNDTVRAVKRFRLSRDLVTILEERGGVELSVKKKKKKKRFIPEF